MEQVTKACSQFLGQLGMAKAGFQILPETWNTSNQTVIVRVGHKYVDEAKSALAFVKEINKKKVAIDCLRVSGSMSNVKKIR